MVKNDILKCLLKTKQTAFRVVKLDKTKDIPFLLRYTGLELQEILYSEKTFKVIVWW